MYDAEDCVDRGAVFETLAECQKYVDRVLARKRLVGRMRSVRSITVVDGRGGTSARASDHFGEGRKIALPSGMRSELVILHEIAHHVGGLGSRHNWQFADAFLALVREMMGVEAHNDLKAEFRQRKVRFRKPVKRTLTPEQRQAAAERLVRAREVRMANEETGRWVLRVDYGGTGNYTYISMVTTKWDRPRLSLVNSIDAAQVWKTRSAVERWLKSVTEEGYAVEIVEAPEP